MLKMIFTVNFKGLNTRGGEKTKKILLNAFVLVMIVTLLSLVASSLLIPLSENGRENSRAYNAPVIVKSGDHFVLTPPGLQKIVFIHYKKGYAKPPWADGGKKETQCYDFLGRWVKWKELPVNYVIDPDNPYNLTEEFITDAIYNSAEEWDSYTSSELFGSYSIDYEASWDSDAPDGRNELLFGDYPQEGVIAVTVVWGYFYGPPDERKIIEFDILFDTDFVWGDATADPNVMDLQNIATHELGHGVGLDDLYDTVCSEETMYGYSDYGETKKRTLNTGDITGLQELYGS
jgi:hypothetical protein